jgi:hypothetical protein
MPLDKIIDRVQKLLRLASNAGSEVEAALAASRAADLMREYSLSEAEIRAVEGDRPAESIAKEYTASEDRHKVAWKGVIAAAVAHTLGARMFWIGGSIKFFGRLSACQAGAYTSQYLWNEVNRLANAACSEAECISVSARAWKSSFRMGCSSRIAQRLYQEDRDRAIRAKSESAMSAPTPVQSPSPLALAIIDHDAKEVEEEYETYSKHFRKTRCSSAGRKSHDGFSSGRAAGERVSLGGHHAGLRPATKQVEG